MTTEEIKALRYALLGYEVLLNKAHQYDARNYGAPGLEKEAMEITDHFYCRHLIGWALVNLYPLEPDEACLARRLLDSLWDYALPIDDETPSQINKTCAEALDNALALLSSRTMPYKKETPCDASSP